MNSCKYEILKEGGLEQETSPCCTHMYWHPNLYWSSDPWFEKISQITCKLFLFFPVGWNPNQNDQITAGSGSPLLIASTTSALHSRPCLKISSMKFHRHRKWVPYPPKGDWTFEILTTTKNPWIHFCPSPGYLVFLPISCLCTGFTTEVPKNWRIKIQETAILSLQINYYLQGKGFSPVWRLLRWACSRELSTNPFSQKSHLYFLSLSSVCDTFMCLQRLVKVPPQ